MGGTARSRGEKRGHDHRAAEHGPRLGDTPEIVPTLTGVGDHDLTLQVCDAAQLAPHLPDGMTLTGVESLPARAKPAAAALHRSLHYYLDVPVELLVYPDEGHGLTKYSHRKAKLSWDTRWFDHHVLNGEPAKPAMPAISVGRRPMPSETGP